jgi:hypothetical protein
MSVVARLKWAVLEEGEKTSEKRRYPTPPWRLLVFVCAFAFAFGMLEWKSYCCYNAY